MKITNLIALALIIGIVCTPAASAGFFDDVKETLIHIKFQISGEYENIAPGYSSYEGSVLNPENGTQIGYIGDSTLIPSRSDYATFPANEYGKLVFSTESDPFTKQYQSNSGLQWQYGCNVQSSTQFALRFYRDDGTYEEIIRTEDVNAQSASWLDYNISYYDTNGDGVITIEVIHEDTQPQLDFTYIQLGQSINTSIPEPVEETTTDVISGGSSSSGSTIISSDIDDSIDVEVPVKNTLLSKPIVTIPGFESVFALVGLVLVARISRRNKK